MPYRDKEWIEKTKTKNPAILFVEEVLKLLCFVLSVIDSLHKNDNVTHAKTGFVVLRY